MRSGWMLSTAIGLAAMAAPAHAVTFDLTNPLTSTPGSSTTTYVSGTGNVTVPNAGNSLTYDVGGLKALVTAYSYNPSTGLINKAGLNIYSGLGIGVQDLFEKNVSPDHSIDSSGMVDFVVLQFNQAVNFTGFSVGWGSGDTDATVAWLNTTYGALNLNNTYTSAFNVSGSQVFKESGVVLGNRTVSIPTSVNTVVIYAGGASGADYFKLNTVNATSAVPEPATWAMMLIGFGAVGATMRRKQARKAMLATAAA